MACALHHVQEHLLAAQAGGGDAAALRSSLSAALDSCGLLPPLVRRLAEHPSPAAVLGAATAAAAHPSCTLGVLLARLLEDGVLRGAELLAATDAGQLAPAVAALGAAAMAGTLAGPAAATASRAFATLLKLLVTSSDGGGSGEAAKAAEQALAQLRREWSGGGGGGSSDKGGAALLASVVDVVDGDVFPRQRAVSWLAGELERVLRASEAGAAAGGQAPDDGAPSADPWADAMAAFASALPADVLLRQAQQVVWAGEPGLHSQRAAALLTAAVQQQPAAAALVERWIGEQAVAALEQHAAGPLRWLVLLQRALLLCQDQQQPQQGQQAAHPPPAQQTQQPQSAQQRYRSWFAATLLAPTLSRHLQFLVQHLLLPLLPEEAEGGAWLQAQADLLAGLQRMQQAQAGGAGLPAGSAQAVQEYLAAAKTRLRALAQQREAAGRPPSGGPAAPLTNLQRGRAIVEGLVQEFVAGGGHLSAHTINQMQAKAASVFQRAEITNMLAPALLAPTGDAVEADKRGALAEHLYAELGRRGDTVARSHFAPEAVVLYRRRCLQARLESASLQQLAERAPLMLASGVGGGGEGLSPHQLLARMQRLVGEHLQRWQQQQQQQGQQGQHQGWTGGGSDDASGPEELVSLLLSTWQAAYPGGSSGSGGAPAAAVAAHVLSIAQGQPLLHAPLLRRLRQALLEAEPLSAAGPSGFQLAGASSADRLSAAAMLATTAGALVQQPQQQPSGGGGDGGGSSWGSDASPASAPVGDAASLQPLFVWHSEQPEGGAAVDAGGPASVPGPAWLAQLLQALPLGNAAAMAHAQRVAQAHLQCRRHFRLFALLSGDASSSWGQAAPAPSGGWYAGEVAGAFVFPACAAALQLHRWLQLRLSLADQLLPGGLGDSGAGAGAAAEQAAKRPRLADAAGEAAPAPDAGAVLEACSRALHAAVPLAEAAGKLPFSELLRLEAAASIGGSNAGGAPDLLPPGATDAALRFCCELFLEPGAEAGLGALVQPLAAAAAVAATDAVASTPLLDEILTIADSEDDEEETMAAAPNGGDGGAAAVAGLAAAVAEALVGSSPQPSAVLAVCQRAAAHVLRVLAAAPGGRGLRPQLLDLLSGAAAGLRQRLPLTASPAGGWHEAAELSFADAAATRAAQQQLAALGAALLLDLLPLPLGGGASRLAQQRRQLAAVGEALRWALSDAGLGAGGGAVRQRLEQALGA